MTGAEYTAAFLREHSAGPVFGYPGANILPLTDAIGRAGVGFVTVRHEQGAVHAAAGFAKASGKTGVCIATSGPGATNLVTGIADAYLDSTPLLVITGQVPTRDIGRDAFQEADIMGVTIPVSKHNYLIRDSRALAPSLTEAWEIAGSGRMGPVLIDIAADVLEGELAPAEKNVSLPRIRRNPFTAEKCISSAARAFAQAQRPLVLAGGGVAAAGASGLLSRFCAENGIPAVTTMMGKNACLRGCVSLGMAGRYGRYSANAALAGCDLLIASGVRFSDRTIDDFSFFGSGRIIVHNDADAAEIGKNVPAHYAAVCGADEFFERLLALRGAFPGISPDWIPSLRSEEELEDEGAACGALTDREIMRVLEGVLPPDGNTVIVTDVGDSQVAAARELSVRRSRGFVTSGGLGAMGFGLPAALGAAYSLRGEPDARVFLVVGDGGFQMTVEELAELRMSPVPVKIMLFDNNALGMIEDIQDERYGGRHYASHPEGNPDFSLIAAAYSLSYTRADAADRGRLAKIIGSFTASEKTEILHFITK